MVTIRLFGDDEVAGGNQESLSLALNNGRQVKDLVGLLDAGYPAIGELIHKKEGPGVGQSGNSPTKKRRFETGTKSLFCHRLPVEHLWITRVTMPSLSVCSGKIFLWMRRSIGCEAGRSASAELRFFSGPPVTGPRGRMSTASPSSTTKGWHKRSCVKSSERALKDFDIIEVAILHRYGEIGIGENIVLIVVGAEHRAEAFRACKWAIDELKQITPIWKLEHTPEGEVWVEEHP